MKLLIACDASAAGRGCWQCAGCQSCSEEVGQSARVCSWNEAAACWCEWGIALTGIDQGARAAKWSSVGLLCTRMDFVDRMSVASLLSRRLAAVCLPCFKCRVCALAAAVCAQCAVDRVSCHNPVCWRASWLGLASS